MIRSIGFESDRLSAVTGIIDKFIEDITKKPGSTFRLIDIKFSSTAKPLEGASQFSDINYAPLVIYEI